MNTSRGLFMFGLVAGLACLGACEAGYHSDKVRGASDRNALTVGTVQKEISKGMSADKVVEALGSPNIVTTDETGREVWVYDRFATDVVASQSSWFVSAGAASSSQRSLTVVIKFDEAKRVRDFAYHSSKF